MKTSQEMLQSLQGVKKYTLSELSYKCTGHNQNGGYFIDAYHDGKLLMTYGAYYDYRKDEFKLYPFKRHRMDARTPGYHTVPNRIVKYQ